jgi:hypothetical protein
MKDRTIEFVLIFLFGMIIGMVILMIINGINPQPIRLSQETGNEICSKITNDISAIADYDIEGKLICKTITYSPNKNIILLDNSEEEVSS